jgi:translation initiation factor 2B subunit (eIF-2B alpha/beta/delta family)
MIKRSTATMITVNNCMVIATRIAINDPMINHYEDHGQSIDGIDQHDVRESERSKQSTATRIARENQKETTIN